jgi:hypothetical protein
MRAMTVVLESSRGSRTFARSRTTQPEILAQIAAWLAKAERVAEESGACISFTVGVHVDGPDCDHGRPVSS